MKYADKAKIKYVLCTLFVFVSCLFHFFFTNAYASAPEVRKSDTINAHHETMQIEVATAFFRKIKSILNPYKYTCIYSSTDKIYHDLANGQTFYAIATEPNDEQQALLDSSGYRFRFTRLFNTPLVIFVNKNNSIEDLTLSDLTEIYNSVKWWPEGDLCVTSYQLTNSNGSQHCISSIIGDNRIDHFHLISADMNSIIHDVSENPGGIAYAFWEFYKTAPQSENTKIITINGKSPDNNSYELLFPVYLITRLDR